MFAGAQKKALGYIVAIVVIAAATAVLKAFGTHVNHTTVALALLLVVLFVATAWGSKPAVVAALLGVASFNFFFLPPVGTFTIADPENWIALLAFLITAITTGQLSARAKQRAEEATAAHEETERLYHELQDTFERSSQAKALKQSEQLKTALLDAVTHDLRTPLTAIKASITTLLEDGAAGTGLGAEGRQEMMEIIDEEADRLNLFIESMMHLAQVGAGDFQLRKHWSSIDEIILTAMKRAEPRTRHHRIELWLNSEIPPVNVDERALEEVVYVLVDNAAKYSPRGSLIKVSANPGANQTAEVSIEDQGPGIPVDLRERVFDKFYRATGPDRLQPSGTGMGLAIARGIIEAHGGSIRVEDSVDHPGARFVVSLPTSATVGNQLPREK